MKKLKLLFAGMIILALSLVSSKADAGKWEAYGQAYLDGDGCMWEVKECVPAILRFQCTPGETQLNFVGCY